MHAGENMKLADVLLVLLTGLSWLQSIFVPIAKHIWLNCKVYFSYTSCTLARIWNVLLVLLTGLTSWLRPPPVASRRCPKHQLSFSPSKDQILPDSSHNFAKTLSTKSTTTTVTKTTMMKTTTSAQVTEWPQAGPKARSTSDVGLSLKTQIQVGPFPDFNVHLSITWQQSN